jgi:hypothetical protein
VSRKPVDADARMERRIQRRIATMGTHVAVLNGVGAKHVRAWEAERNTAKPWWEDPAKVREANERMERSLTEHYGARP